MIGDKFKKVRQAAGLNQYEFAKRLGMKVSGISSIETGRAHPSYLVLMKLMEEFNVDPRWLFDIYTDD
ncbi:MAG: helix-turn-helix transcriptional regulator [Nitrospirae bacterium]|nr:helix-turn-helix transcriptional regulator [Nitrospirota bacterium]